MRKAELANYKKLIADYSVEDEYNEICGDWER